MTPQEIQKELKDSGSSQAQIARELGITKAAVHFVIFGNSVSDRIQRAICKKIDREPEEVFPDYYQRRKGNN
jgi:predicted transcriptional regulator